MSEDRATDPMTAILGIALIFLGGMELILGAAFVVAWRRKSGPPGRPATNIFDLFGRRNVLIVTSAAMVVSGLLAVFWIWFILLYRG